MALIYDLLVVAHFLGLAALIGGVLGDLRRDPPTATGLPLVGAWVQVITGIALTGIASAGLAASPPNNTKITIKLVVALVVLVLVYVARRAPRSRVAPVLGAAGALAALNVFIAALW